MKSVPPLNDAAIHTLHEMHRYHPSRRARLRAHSLLLSPQGLSMPQIARLYQVDRRRVSSWIDRWQTPGLVGLYDQPGAGRRPTLSADEQHKVQQYLQQSPKDLKQVVHKLEQDTSKRVSTKTIKRFLNKSRSIWTRSRKSPVKSPDPPKSERSKEGIPRLHPREAAGAWDLWYFDVTGFCFTPCIPYAWQPIGPGIEGPTSSHGRRLNGRGCLTRNNDRVPYRVEGKVDTAVLVAGFEQLRQPIDKKTYGLRDNGPLHRAQECSEQRPKWVKKGLIIKYLPPYSPALNLLEIGGRFMKDSWRPFSAYASFQGLVAASEEMLTRVGTEYTITFQAA